MDYLVSVWHGSSFLRLVDLAELYDAMFYRWWARVADSSSVMGSDIGSILGEVGYSWYPGWTPWSMGWLGSGLAGTGRTKLGIRFLAIYSSKFFLGLEDLD